jgi:dTMP kinase
MTTLIAIEGIDGSGKGTQTQLLKETLQERGVQTGRLQFPRYSETLFGKAIGEFLNGRFGSLGEVHPQLAALLYAGDRFESRTVLLQMIAANDVVVLDRFVGSNLAHQAAKLEGIERQQLIDWIQSVEFGIFGLPQPHLSILIDMSSQWSQELVSRKGDRDYTNRVADLQESDLSYLEKVRLCYRDIAESHSNWSIVKAVKDDGTLASIDEIHTQIMQLVLPAIRPPV